jgi:hypothetical protein
MVAAALALALATPLAAQQAPQGRVGRVYGVRVKAGMTQQFEAGLKKHAAWHRAQKDTWTWEVWEGETGPATGQYVIGTFGHGWEDFDKPPVDPQADGADFNANVAPAVESVEGVIVVSLPEVSQWTATAPPKLIEVITLELHSGAEDEFLLAVRKTTEAIQKTKWAPAWEWNVLASGGSHPTFYLVIPHDTWASMAPPEKSFKKMLEEGLGADEAAMVDKIFSKTIKAERSELLRYRADLAYTQAAATPPAK